MNTQPKALRLADWCDENSSGDYRPSAEAAAELRRLYALNQELLEALKLALDEIEHLVRRVEATHGIMSVPDGKGDA